MNISENIDGSYTIKGISADELGIILTLLSHANSISMSSKSLEECNTLFNNIYNSIEEMRTCSH